MSTPSSLETQIAEWREHVAGWAVNGELEELEGHLRDQISDLSGVGLSDEEAFLIAVKRIGRSHELSSEFARGHTGRLWRQLLPPAQTDNQGLWATVITAILAAVLVQAPRLIVDPTEDPLPMIVNGPILVLATLAGWFMYRRKTGASTLVITSIVFVAGWLVMNLYPWEVDGDTFALAAAAMPVALWFAVALPYMSGSWRLHERRMDFVRFTGEWLIYFTLIGLGGAVLTGLSAVLLSESLIPWILTSGAAGATIVAAWLVEAKQAVVENIAPILTAVFTPMFAILVVGATVVHVAGGLEFDRSALATYDALLVVVVGLVLYAISAREVEQSPGWADRIQLVTIMAAVLLDVLVLASMLARVGELGFTPNRVATVSLNVVLLVNLVGACWLSVKFMRGKAVFHSMERWQTSYLPIFGLWAVAVASVLPLIFDFS